jgi:hypothetical protein
MRGDVVAVISVAVAASSDRHRRRGPAVALLALVGIDLAVAYAGGSSAAVGFFLAGVAIWTIAT